MDISIKHNFAEFKNFNNRYNINNWIINSLWEHMI